MIEQICVGACNRRYREAWKNYDLAVTAWKESEEIYPERYEAWQVAVAEEGEDAAGPAPERMEYPEEPDIKPRYGEPIWCRGCTASIRRCLTDLEELHALRSTMTDGYEVPGKPHAERVRGSKERASASPGQDDLDDAVRWLKGWEESFRATQGWPTAPYRGVNAPALTSTLAWLDARLDAILAHPDIAPDFGFEVLKEHSRLQSLTSTRPPMRHKPLPCPRCQRLTLFRHDDETIRCHNADDDCGRIMTSKEYAEYEEETDRTMQQEAS